MWALALRFCCIGQLQLLQKNPVAATWKGQLQKTVVAELTTKNLELSRNEGLPTCLSVNVARSRYLKQTLSRTVLEVLEFNFRLEFRWSPSVVRYLSVSLLPCPKKLSQHYMRIPQARSGRRDGSPPVTMPRTRFMSTDPKSPHLVWTSSEDKREGPLLINSDHGCLLSYLDISL